MLCNINQEIQQTDCFKDQSSNSKNSNGSFQFLKNIEKVLHCEIFDV